MPACSSDSGTGADASIVTTTTLIPFDECERAADEAVEPLQDFVDEYDDLTAAEWNELVPIPDAEVPQQSMVGVAQAAVDRGCDPTAMETLLAERIAELQGEGEVGQSIAAALRGDGPIAGPPPPVPLPTQPPRETAANTISITTDDDIGAVLATIAPGSTISFAPGVYEIDEPIVVDVDVTFQGAGLGETIISSSAEGVAVTFVGPGGFALEDITIEHVGSLEASVLVVIEGPLRITRSELRGGVAGTEGTGGGHGLVIAFDPLEGFPERSAADREGPLVIESSRIVGNAAAGVLLTGPAAPTITDTLIATNGGCGVCYTSTSGGRLESSTVSSNQIGVQISETASLVIHDSSIVGSENAGISLDGESIVEVTDSIIEDNGGVGVQSIELATATIDTTLIQSHGVGVLSAGDAIVRLTDDTIANHDIGVQSGGAADVDVTESRIWASATAGVSYGDDSTGELTDNTVDDAPESAIQVIGKAAPNIIGNTILAGGAVGISFTEEATGLASANEITAREVGVQVGGSAAPVLTDNVVLDSVAVGILFGDLSSGEATGNEVTSPEAVGMLVGGDATPLIELNRLVGNGVGLVFRERAAGEARRNTISEHTIGMQIVDEASPFVFANDIDNSTEAGVAFAGTSSAVFEQNTLVRNGNISIQIAESAQPTIAGNEVLGEAVYGLLYRDAGGGAARNNRVANHVYGIQLDGTAAPVLTGNSMEEIALTSIVYSGASGGRAAGNHCTESFSAGISVADDADPELADNDCSLSRAG